MPSPDLQLVPGLRRVASFRPGVWNGRDFSKQFVQYLHDNFQEFSVPKGGKPPWYVPFININHKDEYRFGKITRVDIDKSGTLYLWAENLPQFVADWLSVHMLDERSIEFIEPKLTREGQLLGFTMPNGEVCKTPVLKCLSLLGNDVPAVKGLPPIPPVTYMRDTGGLVSKFSSRAGGIMNQELLNQLQSLGFDLGKLPADATDDLLNEIIKAIQAANANPPANGNGNGTGTQTNMAQTGAANTVAAPAVQTPAVQTPAPVVPQLPGVTGQPDQVILKFRDDLLNHINATVVAPLRSQLNQLQVQTTAAVGNAHAFNERERDKTVSVFLDRMGSAGRVTPAMRPGVEKMLKKCDYIKVAKFSAKLADGRETGTELDEQMNFIETTYPVQRTHNDPHVQQGNPSGPTGVRPEIVQRALQSIPEGRAILQRQKAAGAK